MRTLILTLLLLPMFLLAQTVVEKYPDNPVLNVGPEGSWDAQAVVRPSVIVDGDLYKMWYSGHDGINPRIGYATSPDGVNWTKANDVNPVLDIGANGNWDDEGVSEPSVIFDGEIYKMWFTGWDGTYWRIGYATSQDGINWIKNENPVLDKGTLESWELVVFQPRVIYYNNEYIIYYAGYDGMNNVGMGYAQSDDGVVWNKEVSNPVLTPSYSWENPHISPGAVFYSNNTFCMYYLGGNGNYDLRTGYATSVDGKNWSKNDVYVLNYGAYGEWDYKFASISSSYFDGSKYQLWYDSYDYDDATGAIGYATSDTTTAVGITKEIAIPEVYELSQNYPNPFNPSTIIKYQIPSNVKGETRNVKLIVYDVLGREVATLVNKQQKAGTYNVQFTTNNEQLTSGVYFYQLKAGAFVETKKMILLR